MRDVDEKADLKIYFKLLWDDQSFSIKKSTNESYQLNADEKSWMPWEHLNSLSTRFDILQRRT